eukprot:scaffold98418_cov69-Phaeocystis_antarctica.AAC.6
MGTGTRREKFARSHGGLGSAVSSDRAPVAHDKGACACACPCCQGCNLSLSPQTACVRSCSLHEKETFIEDREYQWGQRLQPIALLIQLVSEGGGQEGEVMFNLSRTRADMDGESKQESLSRTNWRSLHTPEQGLPKTAASRNTEQ